MKAISNAGPLIALAKLGQLGLLMKLFDEIVIPREVFSEVGTNGLLLGATAAVIPLLLNGCSLIWNTSITGPCGSI